MADAISLNVNTAEFRRWLNAAARDQIPFAAARALTLTAKDAQADIKAKSRSELTLRNAHTERGIRIKPARKEHGLWGMKAEVGSIDWYMSDQAGERDDTRTPIKASYRYIPRGARKTKASRIPKRMTPAALASNPHVFWKPKRDGTSLVFQRVGRGRKKLKLLHVAVPRQNISPAFSLADTVRATAQRRIRRHFVQSMQRAIKSAR